VTRQLGFQPTRHAPLGSGDTLYAAASGDPVPDQQPDEDDPDDDQGEDAGAAGYAFRYGAGTADG